MCRTRCKTIRAALIKLRNQLSIGSAGGLTMNLIKQLQGYFGAAIKKNKNNLAKMKDAIFAIFYHKLNDHKFCQKDKTTWCKHIRMIKYKSNDKQTKNLIKREIMKKTKQVFVKFTNHNLLIRCLKGLTQNVCESFNSLIWIRVPKSTYRSIDSIKLGVYDAVICSNESYSHRLKVFDKLKLNYIEQTIESFKNLDKQQLKHKHNLRSKNTVRDKNTHECYKAGEFFLD